jgi:hypothetical protein
VIQNDVLVAAIYWENSLHPAITAPAGWVAIRQDGNTVDEEVALYYRVAGTTEPASYTWLASTSIGFTGIIAAYSGVDVANPIEVSGAQTGTSSSGASAPSLTTTTANDWLIGVWSAWNNKVTLSPPAGMTSRRQFASGDPLTLADKALGAAGPTGVQTASVSKAPGFWTGQALVLRPGSGSPAPTNTPTATPIGTASPTPTWTATPVPSATPIATNTPTPTWTPVPTPTSTSTPTLTPTPTPTPTPGSAASITFRAFSSTNVSGKTLTILRPTGVVQNDVMVAAIYWDNSRQPTITAPAGWVAIRRDGSTTNEEVALYYRVATAVEPASYSWTASRSIGFTGIIAAYAGASTTNPIDAQFGLTGNTASPVAPSVTAAGVNDLLITVWSAWNNNVTITPPVGMTSRAQFTASDPIDLADTPLADTGATGTQTATASTSPGFWTGQSVALRAAP